MAKGDENIPSMLAVPEAAIQPRRRKFLRFNRSPLARKIIVFNLIALGILVAGVLYLNQTNEGRVSQRRDDMVQQAEILAAALAAQPSISNEYFEALSGPVGSIVRLYNLDGSLAFQHFPANMNEGGTLLASPENTSLLTSLLQGMWQNLTDPLARSGTSTDDLLGRFDNLVSDAILNPDQTQHLTFTSSGDLYVTVTAAVRMDDDVTHIVLISTLGGEIDAVIRAEREQILQIFILAILSSIALSIVLANSIARPLRRLADAADIAHDSAGGRLNPAQIQIPDLTARPDEIGELSRAMRQMIEALFERIDENKNFAADVAHEIKNPLTSLRSAVETLAYPLEKEDRDALLAVIQADVGRLDRLVTDISNASRLEGELVRDVWKTIDIVEFLKNHVEYFGTQNTDISLSFETNVDQVLISALDGRLAQVFVNLITNAMGFVPENGWIKISVNYDGADMVEILVTDNGPGIPPDNLEDVFNRFYSERPEAQFGEHSGLGLAISKQIVEVHNGTIFAQNVSENGGAQFVVRLPV